MSKLSEQKKSIIIVPGLAESAAHFKKLKQLLEKNDFAVIIVPSWNTGQLTPQSADLFIGHSLGANLVLHKKLAPALIVGTADGSKVRKNVIRSLLAADMDALRKKRIFRHIWHRINNAWTIIFNFQKFLKLARTYKNIDFFHYKPDSSIVIIQNTEDYIVQTTDYARTQPGTHEDFVLFPEKYMTCIKELSELPQHRRKGTRI